ncbi:hypothetical protein [Streptomyces echinatus]|uniref:hypothetical protein n=1 Tax=Streptomyces echinatus TaxID=67293 RepID=UPI003CD08683
MLEAVEADVHLVGTLLSLHKAMAGTPTKEYGARGRGAQGGRGPGEAARDPYPGDPSPAPWTAARACQRRHHDYRLDRNRSRPT